MDVPANKESSLTAEQPLLEPIWSMRLGWLLGVDSDDRLLVDFDGNHGGPCPARRTIPLSPEQIREAVVSRQRAALLFENGNPRLPVVVGLDQAPSLTPMLDAALAEAEAEVNAVPVEAQVDGQRVLIEGKDEIVLRCGKASLTLRRNGRVVLKGAYLETHSEGINRIKGGSVQVN
jgi:Domain of unknown function (DUF6484)